MLIPVLLLLLFLGVDATPRMDPYFPGFHVRPAAGHNNDPNGPFRDPQTGLVHLFMQYCALGPCSTGNHQGWAHFVSADLAHWTELPVALTAGDNVTACPDTLGVFSGSATIVNNTEVRLLFPGIHNDPAGQFYSSQCMAWPVDPSDPHLVRWHKALIIADVPHGVDPHFHDDSEAWFSARHQRWYMFVSGADVGRSYGVNMLYSSGNFDVVGWRLEHSLWNITDGECNFVSCPELYNLPLMPPNTRVYEALCGGDNYWLGLYDDDTLTFKPDGKIVGKYDYGVGRASKSFFDQQTGRRIMWSWILEAHTKEQYPGWDGATSVPRSIVYGPDQHLYILPVVELERLRVQQLAFVQQHLLPPSAVWEVPGVRGSLQLDVAVNFTFPASTESGSMGVRIQVSPDSRYYSQIEIQLGRRSPPTGVVLNNTNLPRGDDASLDTLLPIGTTDEQGIVACDEICNKHSVCTGWVFVRTPHPRCAIKGPDFCAPVSDANCISKIKTGNTPHCPEPQLKNVVLVDTTKAGGVTQGTTYILPLPDKLASSSPVNGSISFPMRILVDRSVFEVYAWNGYSIASGRAYPANLTNASGLQVYSQMESVDVHVAVDVWSMANSTLFM
eukprot:m.261382 g.261382  ORF g.261382 m.261382 type:complete len:614 (-) comp22747_c0_seq7:505-2346(-)